MCIGRLRDSRIKQHLFWSELMWLDSLLTVDITETKTSSILIKLHIGELYICLSNHHHTDVFYFTVQRFRDKIITTADVFSQLVIPPLWSGLKYLENSNWMDFYETVTSVILRFYSLDIDLYLFSTLV